MAALLDEEKETPMHYPEGLNFNV
jgi:hypothetical protein